MRAIAPVEDIVSVLSTHMRALNHTQLEFWGYLTPSFELSRKAANMCLLYYLLPCRRNACALENKRRLYCLQSGTC